jgi:aspartyl-tRNA(Asn)/glutamyl-tRNA(Gln) amidotransferase subunit A
MVPFATASDGGGSIRTPAAFTGLVGLRACYGRVPTFGDTHLAQNAVVGSLTTTVADTALLLDVMAGPDGRDRTCLPSPIGSYTEALERLDLSGLRVAWSRDLGFAVVDPEVAALCEQAAAAFASAIGAALVDRPLVLRDYTLTYAYIEGVDKFVGVDRTLWETRLEELDPLSAPGWAHLSRNTLPEAAAVESARRHLVVEIAPVFDDVDLLLTPMASVRPLPPRGRCRPRSTGSRCTGACRSCSGFLPASSTFPRSASPAVSRQRGCQSACK